MRSSLGEASLSRIRFRHSRILLRVQLHRGTVTLATAPVLVATALDAVDVAPACRTSSGDAATENMLSRPAAAVMASLETMAASNFSDQHK